MHGLVSMSMNMTAVWLVAMIVLLIVEGMAPAWSPSGSRSARWRR